jgi:hypothetical protein
MAALLIAATGLPAEEPQGGAARPRKKARAYSRQIEMHQAPADLRGPSPDAEKEETLRGHFGSPDDGGMSGLDLESGAGYVPPIPPPAEKPEKKKNWILPPAPELKIKDKQETAFSSWGWLAQDVIQRVPEETEEKAAPSEDEAPPPASLLTPDEGLIPPPRSPGLLLVEPASPRSTYEEYGAGAPKMTDRVNERDSETADPLDGRPVQADSRVAPEQARMTAEEAQERRPDADRTWGSERIWDRDNPKQDVLPMAAALLRGGDVPRDTGGQPGSRSSPDRLASFAALPGARPGAGFSSSLPGAGRLGDAAGRVQGPAPQFQTMREMNSLFREQMMPKTTPGSAFGSPESADSFGRFQPQKPAEAVKPLPDTWGLETRQPAQPAGAFQTPFK